MSSYQLMEERKNPPEKKSHQKRLLLKVDQTLQGALCDPLKSCYPNPCGFSKITALKTISFA